MDATRGIALRGAPISIPQQKAISRALSAFDLDAYQGPYGALLHVADIALSRPDLRESILAVNATRNLFIHLLEDLK